MLGIAALIGMGASVKPASAATLLRVSPAVQSTHIYDNDGFNWSVRIGGSDRDNRDWRWHRDHDRHYQNNNNRYNGGWNDDRDDNRGWNNDRDYRNDNGWQNGRNYRDWNGDRDDRGNYGGTDRDDRGNRDDRKNRGGGDRDDRDGGNRDDRGNRDGNNNDYRLFR